MPIFTKGQQPNTNQQKTKKNREEQIKTQGKVIMQLHHENQQLKDEIANNREDETEEPENQNANQKKIQELEAEIDCLHAQIKEFDEVEKEKRTKKEETADYITKIQHLEAQDEDLKTEIENLQERNDNLEEENNNLKAQLYTLTKENEKTQEKMKESEKKVKKLAKAEQKNQGRKENSAGHTPGEKQAGGGTPRSIGSSQWRNRATETSKTTGRGENMATGRFKLQRYPPPAIQTSANKRKPSMGRNPQWSKYMVRRKRRGNRSGHSNTTSRHQWPETK